MILEKIKSEKCTEPDDSLLIKSQVDTILDEISSLTIQHFLLDNFDLDEHGLEEIRKMAAKEFKFLLDQLKGRLAKIDHVDFLTNSLVVILTKHFETQRLFYESEEDEREFETFEHLKDEKSEKKYLNSLSRVLTKHLLPESYSDVKLFNILAQDILTNLVFFPSIDTLADPDFINTRYIYNLTKFGSGHKEKLSKESSNNTGTTNLWSKLNNFSVREEPITSENQLDLGVGDDLCFDNILMLINLSSASTDRETLKQVLKLLKQNIIKIASLRDSCEATDVLEDPDFHHWEDIMAELTRAKTNCQMKLEIPEKELLNESPLKFDQVIESPTKRRYFSAYLQESGGGSEAVLSVWEAIEDMRYVEKNLLHEVGTKIFYTFINRPVPALCLDRNIIRRVESFLVGDSSHQVQGVPK